MNIDLENVDGVTLKAEKTGFDTLCYITALLMLLTWVICIIPVTHYVWTALL